MKKNISLAITLLLMVTCFAQLKGAFNGDVQRFLDNYSMSCRLKAEGKIASAPRTSFVSPHVEDGIEMIDAFIDFDDRSALASLRSLGVKINCEFDDFITARIPVNRLNEVSQLAGVKNVEISKVVELCTDSTLSVTHAGQVLNGPDYGLPSAYDGTGVIIGMIDAGYDYKHRAFRRQDDPTRTKIVRVYDPTNTTGHPVVIGESTLPGSVFMKEQIDTMTYDTNGTHGTHTTSIAAGTHVNGYGGMAPGADVVLCSCRNMDLFISETDVVNCIKYIYSYADSVGKPCVINLSVSSANGAHDATDRISRAVAQSVGPGRIFVVAAGNNGNSNLYSCGPATLKKPFSALLGCNNIVNSMDNSCYYGDTSNEIWVRAAGARPIFRFHILDKNTHRIVWESENITLYKSIDYTAVSKYFKPDPAVNAQGYMYVLISQGGTGKFVANCSVYNLKCTVDSVDAYGIHRSRYQIGFSIYPPRLVYPRQTDSCYLDMWTVIGTGITPLTNIYYNMVNEEGDTVPQLFNYFYAYPSSRCSMGNYALHDSVISAGAYMARNTYYSLNAGTYIWDAGTMQDIIPFSSYQAPGAGPVGTALPTVCAPGFKVVAAGSRYSYLQTVLSHRDLVMRTSDGCIWGVMSGTSMAAPTVAGIIAQWLQINPNLSPSDIKNVIAQTAIKDQFTQNSDNGLRFGPNGKIDAMAGAKYLLAQMPQEIIVGDVNGDGTVDIDDVTMLIDYILSLPISGTCVVEAMDVYQDGMIDIDDVTYLIRKVLGITE